MSDVPHAGTQSETVNCHDGATRSPNIPEYLMVRLGAFCFYFYIECRHIGYFFQSFFSFISPSGFVLCLLLFFYQWQPIHFMAANINTTAQKFWVKIIYAKLRKVKCIFFIIWHQTRYLHAQTKIVKPPLFHSLNRRYTVRGSSVPRCRKALLVSACWSWCVLK